MTDHREPDPNRQCHHGVAHLGGAFVGLVLYDDVYQDSRASDANGER